MNQRTQNQDDSTQPESAPGPATVHVLYLDTAGTEQRITLTFTDQAMTSDPQRLEALQACMAQGVAKAGGVLLAMQLEMSADSVLLEPPQPRAEPAQILPLKRPDALMWAAVALAACTALSLDGFGGLLAQDRQEVRLARHTA